MAPDPFASPTISAVLTWCFSILLILGLIGSWGRDLIESAKQFPRLFTVWLAICVIVLSPFRYMLLEISLGIALPFQSFEGLGAGILLSAYIPIVFGCLNIIVVGLPVIAVLAIAGDAPNTARRFLASIMAPALCVLGTAGFYFLLPYAALTTHWVPAEPLIRATNGPSTIVYEYVVDQLLPLHYAGFAREVGVEEMNAKERLRAHVVGLYCGKKQAREYVKLAYPEYYEHATASHRQEERARSERVAIERERTVR